MLQINISKHSLEFGKHQVPQSLFYELFCSDAASEWAGWALTHLEIGVSVNPVPTRVADYAHSITACPPGFENLTVSLY